jgi:hypothetical protein
MAGSSGARSSTGTADTDTNAGADDRTKKADGSGNSKTLRTDDTGVGEEFI